MALDTPLATPIKLVGVLCLGIELGTFFDIPLEVDTPMDWEWCLSTQMIVGTTPNTKLHHVEDPIFH
jgi:uncharacterized membrane protein